MKKTLTLISAMLVVAGVMATTSLAHDSNNKGNHGSSRAQIFRATLAPVAPVPTPTIASSGATGETGATGATGGTGSTTSVPSGRVQWVQNKKRYNGYVKVRGLAPATTYTAAIYLNADGQGCASATNTALNPPAIKSLTTNSTGKASRSVHGKLSAFKLDKTKSYYVRVNDATGAAVLCGELKLKAKKSKKAKKNHGKSDDKSHGKGKAKGHK
jgi:hypothetical protein